MHRAIPLAATAAVVLWLNTGTIAQQTSSASIVGAWTLNKEASDQPPAPSGDGEREGRGRGRGGPGGGRRGGGGFGGGVGGGGFGRGGRGGGVDREEMERRREAIRDVVQPAERLTITRTESMVIVTTGDGRTTRLATDGSKIKDQSTGIERRTRWEGDRLVSEISGLGRGKATETYSIDPDSHQLIVIFEMQGAAARSGQDGDEPTRGAGAPLVPRRRVYDAQAASPER